MLIGCAFKRNEPQTPNSPGKLKNAKSNRTLVTLREEKKDEDKDKDNIDPKDKSPSRSIKTPKSVRIALYSYISSYGPHLSHKINFLDFGIDSSLLM